jgi:hypothetical protein
VGQFSIGDPGQFCTGGYTPLHAKIGQQALELDFLARALTKAGWLGAKL